MKRPVVFSEEAIGDLTDIHDYLLPVAGPAIARDYILRIHAYCLGFALFPHRGKRRDDLAPGVRVVGYRRQASIVFMVTENQVAILRIHHRGRNLEA